MTSSIKAAKYPKLVMGSRVWPFRMATYLRAHPSQIARRSCSNGSYLPEALHGPKLARVLALAPRIEVEFRRELLTADLARRVAKALPDSLPSGDAITSAFTHLTALHFDEISFDPRRVLAQRAGQFGQLDSRSGGMPVSLQAEMDIQLESPIGEHGQRLRDFPPRRKPAGGLFENQPGCAHAPPPGRSSDKPRPFFLRMDSPDSSMR